MDTPQLEVVSGDALSAIERSQIDMQISTAKKYPRSIKAFLDEAKSMIAANTETAEGCNYRLKRKEKDGTLKLIEGPSIRLLEIAASAYTNLRYGSRIIAQDDQFVTAQGVAMDLQKNVAVAVETRRSIVNKHGVKYGTDMIMVTSNAAGAIARRNALNGLVPRSYVMELAAYAKQQALGDAKSLPERLQRAFDYFTKTVGVDHAKVLAYLEKPSIQDCTLDDLDTLQGLKTMLKDGEITLEAAFPEPEKKPEHVAPDLSTKEDKPKRVRTKPVAQPVPTSTPQVSQTDTAIPADPVVTIADMAEDIDSQLSAAGVELEQFFAWLKASGRSHTFRYDTDMIEQVIGLPEAQLKKLMYDPAELQECIRIYGSRG